MTILFEELMLERFDPLELTDVISSTEIEQRVLGGNKLTVHSQRLLVDDMIINSGDYSFPLFAKGGIPHGNVYIGFLVRTKNEVYVNNQVIGLNQLQLYAPGCELHYTTRASAGWVVLELPIDRLQEIAVAQGYGELDWPRQGVRYIDLDPLCSLSLRQQLQCLFRIARNSAESLPPETIEMYVRDGLLSLLVQAIAGESKSLLSKPVLTKGELDALERLESCIDRWQINPTDDLKLKSIKDLNLRMIERAMRKAYRMTPNRWLQLVRLNAAYRDILHGSRTSVIKVSERWGFGHAGRFAMDYKKVFGESPSRTLKRHNSTLRAESE